MTTLRNDGTRPPGGAGPDAATLIATCDESTSESSDDSVEGYQFDPARWGFFTELAVAEVLAKRVAETHRVRFDATRDKWLRHGTDTLRQPVWALVSSSPSDYARTLVADAAATMPKGKADSDDVTLKLQAKLYKRLNESAGIGAIAKLLLDIARRPGSRLYVEAEQIDALDDPYAVWAGGQLYDLRTAALGGYEPVGIQSHERIHLATMACAPDPDQDTPYWDELMDAIFTDDDEARDYFMAIAGIALTGTSDRAMLVFYGPSGHGKSFLSDVLLSVMHSYAHTGTATLLGDNPDKAQEAEMEGKRLVFVDEGPRSGRVATERLKALTGGTRQTTRALYAKPTSWIPRFTLLLTSNEAPPVADRALRARLRPLDFTDSQPEEVRSVARQADDPKQSLLWRNEYPGILAALMAAAGRYIMDRTVADVPSWMAEVLDAEERTQNHVLAWLEDRTWQQDSPRETPSAELHKDFVDWCRSSGITSPWTLTKWGREMNAAGYLSRKTETCNVRQVVLKNAWTNPYNVGGTIQQPPSFGTPNPPAERPAASHWLNGGQTLEVSTPKAGE